MRSVVGTEDIGLFLVQLFLKTDFPENAAQ